MKRELAAAALATELEELQGEEEENEELLSSQLSGLMMEAD